MKRFPYSRCLSLAAVVINTVLFLLLSILHFYWAFGGRFWYDDVLPTNSNETSRLNPSTAASLMIAFGLLVFAFITAGSQGLFAKYINRKFFRYGALVIGNVFLFRAVGDFKFVGFFKTLNRTKFGINDTQIFSPLCLFIALLSLVIFIGKTPKT